jgi:hypothetical protein
VASGNSRGGASLKLFSKTHVCRGIAPAGRATPRLLSEPFISEEIPFGVQGQAWFFHNKYRFLVIPKLLFGCRMGWQWAPQSSRKFPG